MSEPPVAVAMRAQETLLAGAGKRVRARMLELYGPPPAPSPAHIAAATALVPETDLEGVAFASPSAREFAEREGVTWSDFANSSVGASGAKGYRKEDIRQIIIEKRGREVEG